MTYDRYRFYGILEARLTPKRYHHSLCVQKRAAQLAVIHETDWYKASFAGLVHDICHCDTPEEQLNYLQAHDILLNSFFTDHPQVWHAVTGMVLLRETYKIQDKEILSAVRYHTTGRAKMTTLEQVVYLADATSSDRDYPGVAALRKLADDNLNAAMFRSLQHNMQRVAEQGKMILPDAWEAYNYYHAAQMAFDETEDTR